MSKDKESVIGTVQAIKAIVRYSSQYGLESMCRISTQAQRLRGVADIELRSSNEDLLPLTLRNVSLPNYAIHAARNISLNPCIVMAKNF